MAYPVDQPLLAGKHPQSLDFFRASSQDGQYQPFAPGSETLRLLESFPTSPKPNPDQAIPAAKPHAEPNHEMRVAPPAAPAVKSEEKGWTTQPSYGGVRDRVAVAMRSWLVHVFRSVRV